MSNHIDLNRLLQSYNKSEMTSFDQRMQNMKNSDRGEVILEYFYTFVFPDETSPHNVYNKDTYSQVYTDTGEFIEEIIFSSKNLKKFDPYVMHAIKQAIEKGIIKGEELEQDELFIDMVDIAEQEMQLFAGRGKTPSKRQVNSTLKKALIKAKNKSLNEKTIELIENDTDKEKARQSLIEYALQIPIDTIEKHKPVGMQLREPQMIALFKAYQNGSVSGNAWRKIEASQDDILAVARISKVSKQMAKQVKRGERIEGMSKWDNGISFVQMLDAADILIGMASVIREQSGQKHLSLGQVLPEEVTATVVKGVLANKVNNIDSFEQMAKKQKVSIISIATNVISEALGINKGVDSRDIKR